MTAHPARRRFNVDDYYAMARVGILGEDDRVELIEGEIIEMSPILPRHAACVNRLSAYFIRRVREDASVRIQNPVRLSNDSEPVPDIALLRRRPDFYALNHPTPYDVLLIVEVADTTRRYDRLVKMPLYAAAGIPEYWIVDVDDEAVTIFRDAQAAAYESMHVLHRGERVAPVALSEVEIGVDDILG